MTTVNKSSSAASFLFIQWDDLVICAVKFTAEAFWKSELSVMLSTNKWFLPRHVLHDMPQVFTGNTEFCRRFRTRKISIKSLTVTISPRDGRRIVPQPRRTRSTPGWLSKPGIPSKQAVAVIPAVACSSFNFQSRFYSFLEEKELSFSSDFTSEAFNSSFP